MDSEGLCLNIHQWLPVILATCTSSLGNVIKVDSTKKNCGKLREKATVVLHGVLMWGMNKARYWLLYVLTGSERLDSLHPMAIGLIQSWNCAIFYILSI